MASKNGAKATAKRVQVPLVAAQVLQSAQGRAGQLRAELSLLGILVAGYCQSLKLDATKNYQFVQKGEKVYAEEVEAQ